MGDIRVVTLLIRSRYIGFSLVDSKILRDTSRAAVAAVPGSFMEHWWPSSCSVVTFSTSTLSIPGLLDRVLQRQLLYLLHPQDRKKKLPQSDGIVALIYLTVVKHMIVSLKLGLE